MEKPTLKSGWTILFTVWIIQGLIACVRIVTLPSDAGEGLLFGLTAARLALALTASIFTVGAGWLTRRTLQADWDRIANRTALWDGALLVSLATVFLSQTILAVLYGLSQQGMIFLYSAYASRLAPLLNTLTVSAIELIVWLVWLRRAALKPARPVFVWTLWVWLILGSVLAISGLTGLGIRFEPIGVWSKPTIPFWEWQIVLAWTAGTILILLERFGRLPTVPHPDLWIGLAIWAGVSALWLSQPVNIAWQAWPRAPNFEFYPFSDAQNYDQFAQSILIGNGMFGDAIPARPLYVGLLALMHAIVGQDYIHVIALQSLILAFFPVTLYWIGKEISGRPLGIMLAILSATRDVMTNLSADFAGNFSYSKFYLSELPTALLLGLFTLFLLKGAKRPSFWNIHFMLAGGAAGLAVLMRTQSLFVLPPVLLLAYLGNRRDGKNWFRALVLLGVTLALTITPWIWRNWQNSGGLILEDPDSQMSLRALWYHGRMDVVNRLPGENDGEYSRRLAAIALDGIRKDPVGNSRLILAHFLNSEIGNLLVFPVRDGLQSLYELAQPTRAFWEQVELTFSPAQSALLSIYLLLFSLGVADAWRSAKWAGLMPLGINLSYNFSTALFMSSGMRFLLTTDWGFYFYYALGLLAVTRAVLLLLDSTRGRFLADPPSPGVEDPGRGPISWKPVVLGVMSFFLIGSSLPLSESIIPKRYPPASQEVLTRQLLEAIPEPMQGEFQRILAEPDIVVLQGRALYPRYYAAGEGEPGTDKLGYRVEPQARLVFALVGDANSLVIFDLPESPEYFPNASDIVMVANRSPLHFRARIILLESDGEIRLYFPQVNDN